MAGMTKAGDPKIFRFKVGDIVWVRDRSGVKEATVREQHLHKDRHPFYPSGEGYGLDGDLWWDCYPGCRVFATQAEAKAARISQMTYDLLTTKYMERSYGKKITEENSTKG